MASWSPQTWTGSSGSWVSTSKAFPLTLLSRLTKVRTRVSLTSNCCWASRSSDWSRDRSSIDRTSRDSRRVSDEIILRYSFSFSGGIVPSRIPSAKPAMVVIGVLSSWETLATNSLRRCSLLARESAMALNASASSPTSSFRLPTLTRTSSSPWPN